MSFGVAGADERCGGARRVARALVGLLLVLGGCNLFAPKGSEATRVLWRRDLVPAQEVGWQGTPTADTARTFIETDSGVAALEPRTGRVVWSRGLWPSRPPISRNLVDHDGVIYVALHGSVFAIAATDGATRWTSDLSGLAPRGGADWIAADDHSLYLVLYDRPAVVALSALDGHLQWTAPLVADTGFGGIASGVTAAGDTVYLTGARWLAVNGWRQRAIVVAVDGATGRELLRYEQADSNSGAGFGVSVSGRTLLFSDLLSGSVVAVDRFAGRQQWRSYGDPRGFGPSRPPIIHGDTAYVASNDRYVYALDLATGRTLWRTLTGGSISHFALCGRYLVANDQAVVFVDRATHAVAAHELGADSREPGFPTSGFAVSGDVAVVTGTSSAWGIDCR